MVVCGHEVDVVGHGRRSRAGAIGGPALPSL